MPISLRTEASRRRKKECEEKLAEVERNIEKFKDKKTIYIEIGEEEDEEHITQLIK